VRPYGPAPPRRGHAGGEGGREGGAKGERKRVRERWERGRKGGVRARERPEGGSGTWE